VPEADERARALLSALPELDGPATGLFDRREAQVYSCYAGIENPRGDGADKHGGKILRVIPPGRLWPEQSDSPIAPQGEAAHDMLRAHILGEYFPCIGARSAFSQGTYRFGFYKELAHLSTVASMGRDLRRFTDEYEELGDFTTFVAVFKHPQLTSEDDFERLFWRHLQKLHDNDGDTWDPHYDADPEGAHFGFSFNGKAFFVVGMHAGASRFSRRFAFPSLIFNPESQIRRLKEASMLERFAAQVRQRDTLYQGSINPSLPTDANSTGGEARVYSGKKHTEGDGWKCPFHPRPAVLKVKD
jgi:hypothetical protein